MGTKLFDQYSLLHFASGVVVYFWGFTLLVWIILHTIFEIVENSSGGVYFIDKYITYWPGGKKKPDTLINSIGDILFGIIGFISAKYLDLYYK